MFNKKFQKIRALFLSLLILETIIPNNLVFAATAEESIIYENNFEAESSAVSIGENKALEFNVEGDISNDWKTIFQKDLNFDYTEQITSGSILSFDLLLPEGSTYTGALKAQAVTKMGDGWTWTDSKTIPEIKSNEFADLGKGYLETNVSIAFGSEIEAIQGLKAIIPCLAASNCDYEGKIYLDNVKLVNGEDKQTEEGKIIYENDFELESESVSIGGNKALEFDVTGDIANSWLTVFQKELTYDYTEKINASATLSFDLFLPEGSTYTGALKAQAVTKMGDGWTWTDSKTIPEIKSNEFADLGKGYLETNVSIAFGSEIEAIQGLKAIIPCLAASNCDYVGKIYLDNVKLVNGGEKQVDPELPVVETLEFNFDNEEEINAWKEEAGYVYDGGLTISHNKEIGNGSMQLGVDYSANVSASWSEAKVKYTFADEVKLEGYNKFSFDFIYDPAKMTGGSFKAKLFAKENIDDKTVIDTDTSIENEQDYGNGLKKAIVVIKIISTANSIDSFTLGLIGSNTDYKGALYIDNIAFSQEQTKDIYVEATKTIETQTPITVNTDSITANGVESALSKEVKLVDDEAISATSQLYAYLEAVGKTDSVLYGHQNDIHHKAGNKELTNSDTKDVTGSIAAVVGIDTLSLTGNELGSWDQTQAERVTAAAKMTKEAADQGAIITLSAHMPNFEVIRQRVLNHVPGSTSQNSVGKLSDGSYNFSGYTPGTLTGDIATRIMPGQDLNYLYTAYLDMIADYAKVLEKDEISVLFRPFHENTGSWFWWGAAFCDKEAYKNLYKYTVEYLRDTKGVHNFIYVYGPSSDAESTTDYEKRYPGDDYVDMVGFDMYHQIPAEGDNFIEQFKKEISIVGQFAKEHKKLFAVTETGVANGSEVLKATDNARKDWYREMLDAVAPSDASYFLLWANFSATSFYTPYVVSKTDTIMRGHEMLDNFIDFYNDSQSVFANELGDLTGISVDTLSNTNVTGYITAPISGGRVLKAVTIEANVSKAKDESVVQFVAKNKTGEVAQKILATKIENGKYRGELTEDRLALLGESAGTLSLEVDGKVCNTINIKFNMPEAVVDPTIVDTFENYYGENEVMNVSWSTGKGSGCTIVPSLSDKKYEGDYALKFKYSLVAGGYVGVTKSLSGADWSSKNAVQFWTVPDGKNQKVVIQVTSGGSVFEVYPNEYDGYKDKTNPILVTIPFSSLVGRDNKAAVFNASSIESFGLWCNAVVPTGENANLYKLDSIIYYDSIKAINSDVKAVTFSSVVPPVVSSGSTTTQQGGGTSTSNTTVSTSDQGAGVATVKLELKTENGQLIAEVSKAKIQEAINAISKVSTSNDKEKTALTLKADLPTGTKHLDIALSKESLQTILDSTTEGVLISTAIGKITLNTRALSSIVNQTGSGCKLSLAVSEDKTDQVKKIVGDRPIYSIQLVTDNKTALKFDSKAIKVELPYEKQSGENCLVIYTLDENNHLKIVANSLYDNNKKEMIFKTDSLTRVVIVDNKKDFLDIINHWAKNSIEQVAALELLRGVSENRFAADKAMTRGMLVTILSRLAEIEETDVASTSFSDVAQTQWYAKAVAWATKNGIATGVSTSKFDPNKELTREEMAVIIDNYMKYAQISMSESNVEIFSDNDSISPWAKSAVAKMKATGIINGKNNNAYDPKGKTTRAEVAAILIRLIEVSVK